MQTAKRISITTASVVRRNTIHRTIVIHGAEFIDLLPVSGIQHVKAESNYCRFVMQDGVCVLASKPLGYYEGQLKPHGFVRTHQSFIVNPAFVRRIRKSPVCSLWMTDKTEIPVSRARKKAVLDVFIPE